MGKSQFISSFVWQSTDPSINFSNYNPSNQTGGPGPGPNQNASGNSPTTGLLASGVMSGTNTIYSNIICLAQDDTYALDLIWTGTPTGSYTVFFSVGGVGFNALQNSDYSATPTQPAGSADNSTVCFGVNALRYIYIKYINSSGTGALRAQMEAKAHNS